MEPQSVNSRLSVLARAAHWCASLLPAGAGIALLCASFFWTPHFEVRSPQIARLATSASIVAWYSIPLWLATATFAVFTLNSRAQFRAAAAYALGWCLVVSVIVLESQGFSAWLLD